MISGMATGTPALGMAAINDAASRHASAFARHHDHQHHAAREHYAAAAATDAAMADQTPDTGAGGGDASGDHTR